MEQFAEEKQSGNGEGREMSIDSLLDILVEISVEIGRTKMPIGEYAFRGQRIDRRS